MSDASNACRCAVSRDRAAWRFSSFWFTASLRPHSTGVKARWCRRRRRSAGESGRARGPTLSSRNVEAPIRRSHRIPVSRCRPRLYDPRDAQRRPVSRDRTLRDRLPAAVGRPCHVLGAGGQSARPAGAVPAWRTRGRGRRGASALLRPGILAHRHLRPARRRTFAAAGRAWTTTPRRNWSRISRRCAASSASIAGCCSAVPGARRSPWPMPRPIRSGSPGCVLRGVFLGRPSEVEWFLHGMRGGIPRRHAQFVGFLPEDERGDISAATCGG